MSDHVTNDLVKHVAHLARLRIEEKDLDAYKDHMNKVLGHVAELNKIDTTGISAYISPVVENASFYQEGVVLREDKVSPSLPAKDILQNAPDQDRNQFRLKAVISEE